MNQLHDPSIGRGVWTCLETDRLSIIYIIDEPLVLFIPEAFAK
jgi:hypothetical protein